MSPSDFLIICATGFLAVFLLLALLAFLIRLLTVLFPGKLKTDSDTAELAVIAVTYTSL